MSRWGGLNYSPLLLLQALKLYPAQRHWFLTQACLGAILGESKMLDVTQLQLGFWKWNSQLLLLTMLTDGIHLCVGKHVYGVNMLSVLLKTWGYRSWCEHVQCFVKDVGV